MGDFRLRVEIDRKSTCIPDSNSKLVRLFIVLVGLLYTLLLKLNLLIYFMIVMLLMLSVGTLHGSSIDFIESLL